VHVPALFHLAATDPQLAGLIDDEARRQHDKLRMIASENYVSTAVLEATGSVLTNKYSEGYPGKRYYEGQQFIDQVEALTIDEGITVGDLKGTILFFAQSMWGAERRIRIRPNFFPYTEPSFEFDLSCGVCAGRGCRSCGGTGWLEVGGCGMVHPNVLRNGGIDPARYSGFAWGFGIERIAMLRYYVDDIRLFYENDLRFLEQLG